MWYDFPFFIMFPLFFIVCLVFMLFMFRGGMMGGCGFGHGPNQSSNAEEENKRLRNEIDELRRAVNDLRSQTHK
ncbi:hypothetical protein BMS3Abin01_01388 [bacterium BMS3Abin01]|nr:hypothetical protein BMS3Abin01_01388 [bacterium BMS3Abin01]